MFSRVRKAHGPHWEQNLCAERIQVTTIGNLKDLSGNAVAAGDGDLIVTLQNKAGTKVNVRLVDFSVFEGA